jgi:hypothetical protein
MSADSKPTAPSREALLAVHQFPGEFVIKAFGPGDPEFHGRRRRGRPRRLGRDRVQVQSRTTPAAPASASR